MLCPMLFPLFSVNSTLIITYNGMGMHGWFYRYGLLLLFHYEMMSLSREKGSDLYKAEESGIRVLSHRVVTYSTC